MRKHKILTDLGLYLLGGVLATIGILALLIIIRACQPAPPSPTGEGSPAQQRHVRMIEKRYSLKGYFWAQDKNGTITYYKRGRWYRISGTKLL